MKKPLTSVFCHKNSWHSISFEVHGREISGLKFFPDRTLPELNEMLKETEYCVSLDDSSGYMLNLRFPFSGKRKVSLVIKNEMEGILPFPADDMSVDFKETGTGNVLAIAVPRSVTEGLKKNRNLKNITLNSLAVLYALRWFNRIPARDCLIIHIDGNTAVIMAVKARRLHNIRQFFYSPGSDSLKNTIGEILKDKDVLPETFYMISSSGDADREKDDLEGKFNIRIEMPSLKKYVKADNCPEWAWPGIGAALIAANPRDEINLLREGLSVPLLPFRTGLAATGALAFIGLLIAGMFHLNIYLKGQAYRHLAAGPDIIYKTVFPKSPAVKDPAKMFEEKLRMLEKDSAGIRANTAASPLRILSQISSRIDSSTDVKLHEFVCDEKEFSISGTTVSFASAEGIKAAVEKAEGVRDVVIQNLDMTAGRQVKFKIQGKL